MNEKDAVFPEIQEFASSRRLTQTVTPQMSAEAEFQI